MKLKTFLATYLLFLAVLFACFAIVSAFLVDTQVNMHMERSAAEYQRIAVSLSRDILVLHGISQNLVEDINALLNSYMEHYARADVTLALTVLSPEEGHANIGALVSFVRHGGEYFIEVNGVLPEPFGFFRLDYLLNITDAMAAMNRIQNILLFVCMGFAALTALILYVILNRIFRPLGFVSRVSRKIAGGDYDERIAVRGKNELAAMAEDFNSMADEIQAQMQILKDEADAKQQFVDNIAHELRTPLTSIFGYAEYMQKIAPVDAEMIESMQYIMDEAGHMQNISNSLLTLATLRGYEAARAEIPVGQLFEDIRHSLRSLKNVNFVFVAEIDTIFGQEDLIKSLLLNLCTNAANAGGTAVTVRAAPRGENAVLSVTDNGCGIPKESLAKIFEPFERVDKARNRQAGGAGLGLTLCARIAEAHGAVIQMESTVGIGTRVEVILEGKNYEDWGNH
ncbi:MAG: HAMP domain-containing histidine kinase [Clostridiales bacterium]|jgi:signal transduction histidine kinase|nr:HAMP domain-containing histidine kinase [Clostridiales bacterium]